MKKKIIVDTSVWIKYFRHLVSPEGDEVEKALRNNQVVITGVILAELLQGAKSNKEFESIADSLKILPYLEDNFSVWSGAGKLSFELRKKGITIPLSDSLIAYHAINNQYEIFSFDYHFQKIPGVILHETAHGSL